MNNNILKMNFHTESNDTILHIAGQLLKAFVSLPEMHFASDGEINFELVLKNDGKESISVYNPLYYLQYTIRSEEKILKTDKKPYIPLINSKSEIGKDDFNFNILKIEENDRELDVKQEINKPTIVFGSLKTRKYLLSASGYFCNDSLMSFEAGSYQILFMLSIISVAKDNIESQDLMLNTDPVTIELK